MERVADAAAAQAAGASVTLSTSPDEDAEAVKRSYFSWLFSHAKIHIEFDGIIGLATRPNPPLAEGVTAGSDAEAFVAQVAQYAVTCAERGNLIKAAQLRVLAQRELVKMTAELKAAEEKAKEEKAAIWTKQVKIRDDLKAKAAAAAAAKTLPIVVPAESILSGWTMNPMELNQNK